MPWPMSQDYNEAIQSPATHFADPELRQGRAAVNALGLPMPCSGNFADVYRLCCPGGQFAVKCFTRQLPGLRERYAAVSTFLQRAQLGFMVEFRYLAEGIRVRGQWYPVVNMQWVQGTLLNDFVSDRLDRSALLDSLLQTWVRMARRLHAANMAHGDIQHGNVILAPEEGGVSHAVKLVDYDGVFVPSLAGKPSWEVGHPNYQHPDRERLGVYGPVVDRFPLLVVAAALRCLRVGGRQLWKRYDNGDNLLFKAADFAAPHQSELFAELLRLPDAEARSVAAQLMAACQKPIGQTPLLEEVFSEKPTAPAVLSPGVAQPAAETTPRLAPAQAGREQSWQQPPPRRATYPAAPPIRMAPPGAPPPPVRRAPGPTAAPVPTEPTTLPPPGPPPIHLAPPGAPPPVRRAAAPAALPTPAAPAPLPAPTPPAPDPFEVTEAEVAPTSGNWKPNRRKKVAELLVLGVVFLLAMPLVVAVVWALSQKVVRALSQKPVARWTFEEDARDTIGTMHGTLKGGAVVADGVLHLKGKGSCMEAKPLPQDITARTLAVWVRLSDHGQGDQVIMRIWCEDADCWDGILYARQSRRWYLGSNFKRRSWDPQGPEEDAKPDQWVHLAAVYALDNSITLYRNGKVYGAPFVPNRDAPALQTYAKKSSRVLLGDESGSYIGAIGGASLYARPLTAAEVAGLSQARPVK
jgi:hypothetical protein